MRSIRVSAVTYKDHTHDFLGLRYSIWWTFLSLAIESGSFALLYYWLQSNYRLDNMEAVMSLAIDTEYFHCSKYLDHFYLLVFRKVSWNYMLGIIAWIIYCYLSSIFFWISIFRTSIFRNLWRIADCSSLPCSWSSFYLVIFVAVLLKK